MSGEQRIRSFNLAKQGLGRVLGSLEAEIMDILWARKRETTIREVWERIRLTRPIAFNTVMTVMNRLVDKGLLERRSGPRAYWFRPAQTKESFLEDISRQVAEELVQDFGEAVIAPFVEALGKVNPDYLEALRDFIERQEVERDDVGEK